MASSVNDCNFLGRLGRDAETKFTHGGMAMTRFSMACDRKWKDRQSGEWKEETTWVPVILWGSENLANYLVKGKRLHVSGRLSIRSYESEGVKKYITEIVADEVVLLDGGENAGAGSSSSSGRQPSQGRGSGGGPRQDPSKNSITSPDDDGFGFGGYDPEEVPF